jgi:hypothetical protein
LDSGKVGNMQKSSSSRGPWWSSLGFGKPEAAPDTDYADMGTAFGLDASMANVPATERPAAPDEGPASGTPPTPGRR